MKHVVGIIAICVLCSISSAVFADELYDCNLVASDTTTALEGLHLTSVTPLTQDDMQSAMTDLKAYCCQIKVLKTGCEATQESENNPESPYIRDQFVSRGFFKLDNKIDGSKDTKATEREEDLNKRQESGKGNVPAGIQNAFVELRQPSQRDQANINDETCEITNYDSLPLSARYTAVCEQATCTTQKFLQAVGDLTNRYDETACKAMVTKRIDDEMSYVQTLMVQKTNTFMQNMMDTYVQKYMVEDRLTRLLDEINKVDADFSTVNGKVQEGTKQCSAG